MRSGKKMMFTAFDRLSANLQQTKNHKLIIIGF